MTDLLPLPEITDDLSDNPNTADLVEWVHQYATDYARACVEHALAGRGDGLEPLRKLLQEHLDALTAAQPAEGFSPADLFKDSDGEWMHEVGGAMVRDRYKAGVLIERRQMADLCQPQPAGVSDDVLANEASAMAAGLDEWANKFRLDSGYANHTLLSAAAIIRRLASRAAVKGSE